MIEVWLSVRGDYFSVSELPLGSLIVNVYQLFISPAALYLFLLAGVGVSVFYFLKLKRGDFFARLA